MRRFFGFLSARNVAAATEELHAKAGLAVVRLLRHRLVLAEGQAAALERLEEWWVAVAPNFCPGVHGQVVVRQHICRWL